MKKLAIMQASGLLTVYATYTAAHGLPRKNSMAGYLALVKTAKKYMYYFQPLS